MIPQTKLPVGILISNVLNDVLLKIIHILYNNFYFLNIFIFHMFIYGTFKNYSFYISHSILH